MSNWVCTHVHTLRVEKTYRFDYIKDYTEGGSKEY